MRKAPFTNTSLGPRQIPKPSLGSKISRNLKKIPEKEEIEEEPVEEAIEETRYFAYFTGQFGRGIFGGRWVPVPWESRDEGHATRREAYDVMEKHMWENGNPRGWTTEGDLQSGRLVVYDGIFLILDAPSYLYIIVENIPWGDTEQPDFPKELPDPLSFNPRHEYYSADATRRRMNNEKWDPENLPKGPGE